MASVKFLFMRIRPKSIKFGDTSKEIPMLEHILLFRGLNIDMLQIHWNPNFDGYSVIPGSAARS